MQIAPNNPFLAAEGSGTGSLYAKVPSQNLTNSTPILSFSVSCFFFHISYKVNVLWEQFNSSRKQPLLTLTPTQGFWGEGGFAVWVFAFVLGSVL